MVDYTPPLRELIDEFKKLPGIGPKSAQRLAFHILDIPLSEVERLTESLIQAKKSIKHCNTCFNITANDPCEICTADSRDQTQICVVEETKGLIAIERTGYKGLYHILGGSLSPLDGRGPDDLRVKELLKRLNDNIVEIVLAMNPSTEGEATALYLTKLIKPLGIKLSRIAYGLPIGGDLDYADEATLTKSFQGRRDL